MNALGRSFTMQNTGAFNNNITYSNVKLDMKETKDAYVLTLDIKGLDKNKIDIEVNQNSITISDKNSNQTASFFSTIPIPQWDPQAVTTKINGDSLLINITEEVIQTKQIITAPRITNPPPKRTCQVSFSPKKIIPNMIARATLSLSTGATFEIGPSWMAR